jgi:hypothetical protein
MLTVSRVDWPVFAAAYGHARRTSDIVREMTTELAELPHETTVSYHLTDDGLSGFGVTDTGELIALFSLARGRGDVLVSAATDAGATRLDCFDGYLPSLYARHGFVPVRREENWTPGGPDVVYMSREWSA